MRHMLRVVFCLMLCSITLLMLISGCASPKGNNSVNQETPQTTNLPVTPPSPFVTVEPVIFQCELDEYPHELWPLVDIQKRPNSFWMTVYYADEPIFKYNFQMGVQYYSTATGEELIQHYNNLIDIHEITLPSDVQGYIGDWQVYAGVEQSIYPGERIVHLLVGQEISIYVDNPFFIDYPVGLMPAYNLSRLTSDKYICGTSYREYFRTYINDGSVDEALNHYRTLLSASVSFSEVMLEEPIYTITTLTGSLDGWLIQVVVNDAGTITVDLRSISGAS